MARSNRLQVTVTVEMTIALDALGARTGHTRSAQASLMLRQALDRTIKSASVQDAYRKHVAGRGRNQWLEDTQTERAIDGALTEATEATEDATREVEQDAKHIRTHAPVVLTGGFEY